VERFPYNSPSPRGAEEAIGEVTSALHTMASTDEENDSATNSNRDFFRPLRGSGAVGYPFTHGSRHGLRSFTRVQNRLRQVGNEVRHKRSLCGEGRALSHAGGQANLFPAEIEEIPGPRPLGGEGGPQPALSSAGAGRVRGSKTMGPTETLWTLRPFHFCPCFCGSVKRIPSWYKPPLPPPCGPPSPPRGRGEMYSWF
jgi:hypothetical protein